MMAVMRVDNVELDEIDMKLLELLQDDAKVSYAKLAKKLGISSSGVHKRVKKLVAQGVIKRFIAIVDPAMMGKKLKVFVGISTLPGTCRKVITELGRRPEVLEIHEMAGEHDLFVKIITDDTLKLNDILHELDQIPGVSSSRTLVVLKTEKETNAVKFEQSRHDKKK